MKIEKVCKETILQAAENIKYRLEKNKGKKVKTISNYDFNILLINIDILREELIKLNKEWKYDIGIDYIEQLKRLKESQERRMIND